MYEVDDLGSIHLLVRYTHMELNRVFVLAGSQIQTDSDTHKQMSTHAESNRCILTSRSRTQADTDQCSVQEGYQVQVNMLLIETALVGIKHARMDCSL